jgi:hypothetical protein
VFRERTIYGDIQDYAEAAMRLSRGEPLNTSYLYTPFWATVLEPLARFGPKAIFGVCWLLNMLSIPVFYLLLHATLKAYGFGTNVAGLLCFSFMVVNVPLLRTLGYVQVNLHVTNLILASLVSFPQTRAVSAVTLALAAQIKMSPLALALPYLLRRDYKWLGVFVLTVLATAGLTVAWHGLAPFQEFLFNVRRMREENGLQFRETSFDSFFAAVASFGLLSEGAARAMTVLSKVCLTAALFVIGARGVRHKLFYSHDDPAGVDDDGVSARMGAPSGVPRLALPSDRAPPGDCRGVDLVRCGLLPGVRRTDLRFLPVVLRAPARAAHLGRLGVVGAPPAGGLGRVHRRGEEARRPARRAK